VSFTISLLNLRGHAPQVALSLHVIRRREEFCGGTGNLDVGAELMVELAIVQRPVRALDCLRGDCNRVGRAAELHVGVVNGSDGAACMQALLAWR
jgi:hypothetical protein